MYLNILIIFLAEEKEKKLEILKIMKGFFTNEVEMRIKHDILEKENLYYKAGLKECEYTLRNLENFTKNLVDKFKSAEKIVLQSFNVISVYIYIYIDFIREGVTCKIWFKYKTRGIQN